VPSAPSSGVKTLVVADLLQIILLVDAVSRNAQRV
jgi:hypothetical protein